MAFFFARASALRVAAAAGNSALTASATCYPIQQTAIAAEKSSIFSSAHNRGMDVPVIAKPTDQESKAKQSEADMRFYLMQRSFEEKERARQKDLDEARDISQMKQIGQFSLFAMGVSFVTGFVLGNQEKKKDDSKMGVVVESRSLTRR